MTHVLNRKRGLILGATGLIGGGLVKYFNSHCASEIKVFSPNSKILNLSQHENITRYVHHLKPDFIVNAAIASINSSPGLCYTINYLGAITLAKLALELKIPYVFISSAAVLPPGSMLKEEQQRRLSADLSSYAKSKLMAEMTLHHMQQQQGLDYTSVRLAIVYGRHDHKTQGFQKMLHSIAGQTMPFFLTSKGIQHSYSNASKVPYFIHHALKNRAEFSGSSYNFVDHEAVELVHLIRTIKSRLQVKRPKNIFLPLGPARFGARCLNKLLKGLLQLGIDAKMPAELMFLDQFYESQTLDCSKLHNSSYVDPWPKQSIYSELPKLIDYYIARWEQHNLLRQSSGAALHLQTDIQQFQEEPLQLLTRIHSSTENSSFRTSDPTISPDSSL
jgi:nucleoside-diphosphate-sugar epimerase